MQKYNKQVHTSVAGLVNEVNVNKRTSAKAVGAGVQTCTEYVERDQESWDFANWALPLGCIYLYMQINAIFSV